MAGLSIRIADRVFELKPGQAFTFGRDDGCTVCLDPIDTGISRVAGSIGQEDGTWWIVNRSAKRTLHVVDDTGISVPVPVAVPGGGQPSRRAVDRQPLTVLVAGDIWTHAIEVATLGRPAVQTMADPTSPIPTVTHLPTITDLQREALVALLSGYLQPFPRYDPHPLNYKAAGQLLGATETVVRKRIENVRHSLVSAGVPGLDGKDDARRPLAEWALAMRLVTAEDLAWLEKRLAERRRFEEPT